LDQEQAAMNGGDVASLAYTSARSIATIRMKPRQLPTEAPAVSAAFRVEGAEIVQSRRPDNTECPKRFARTQQIRVQLEAFDSISEIMDEMRDVIETEWPDLAAKLLPPKDVP